MSNDIELEDFSSTSYPNADGTNVDPVDVRDGAIGLWAWVSAAL
jgi:hypothetical protein